MKLIKWKRPSGNPLETNAEPDTIEYLESLGYEQIKAKAKPDPKPGPKPKLATKSMTGLDK